MSAASAWSSTDRRHMRRALALAARSLGCTAPNPGVGCVIAAGDKVLGAGRHQRCGGPHAEINALADCQGRGRRSQGATAYVTLAPCTRHGRTPPCTDALLAAGITRVVAAIADPIQDAAGAILSAGGCRYEVGCMAEQAQLIHGGWLQRVSNGLPRCSGKWAMTLDGFIAPAAGQMAAISDPIAREQSRRRRRMWDAIIIGAETARCDNPQLLALGHRHPARVVVSASASLTQGCALLATTAQAPLIIIHDDRATTAQITDLSNRGALCIAVDDAHDPLQVLRALGDQGHNDVLVEGGARLHHAFLTAGAYQRLELYQGACTWGRGIPVSSGDALRPQCWQLEQAPQYRGSTLCSTWSIGSSP